MFTSQPSSMIIGQRLCAGVRYDSYGSPGSAWHNNCTRFTRSSLVAVPDDLGDDRCRRDLLVMIICTKSCRHMSRVPLHPQKRTAIVVRRKSKLSGWFTLPELGFAFPCPGVAMQRLIMISVKKIKVELSRCRKET